MSVIQKATIVVCCALLHVIIAARPVEAQFSAPTAVSVLMYALDESGAILNGNDLAWSRCKTNDNRFGCTNPDSGLQYPFIANPVTVLIEGTDVDNRYLRDVVSKELIVPVFHQTAVRAQAIASRTYLYDLIRRGVQVTNSSNHQVFVPRSYDLLATAERAKIDIAVSGRWYLSSSSDMLPITSMFFSDVRLRTLTWPVPGFPHLFGVEDPISNHPDIVETSHSSGMSQNGAGRWARGNQSYNLGRDLGPWPVYWSDAQKILTHYYTGIHIRNADNGNAIITPERRSVDLNLRWSPSSGVAPGPVCAGSALQLTARVQNTGITTWPNDGSVYYSYLLPPGAMLQQTTNPASRSVPEQPVAPGAAYTATISVLTPSNVAPGTTLGVNPAMFLRMSDGSGVSFTSLEPGRPWLPQPYGVPIVACPYRAHLPILRKPAGSPASTNPIPLLP